MTFTEAVSSIVNSQVNDAAKRPMWAGYVYRSAVSTAAGTEGDYTLTYKNRAGSTYDYEYDASAGTWTAPSSALPIDAELHSSLLATDWIVGKSSDFAAAAGDSGTW